jgi:hypothetical protein
MLHALNVSDLVVGGNRPVALRPQPVDYGLTYDDLNLYSSWESRNAWSCRLDDGKVIRCLGTRDDDEYKEGRRWFGSFLTHPKWYENAFGLGFWGLIFGGLMMSDKDSRVGGLITLGLSLVCLLCGMLPGVALKRLRTRASPALEAYWQALHKYDKEKAAAEAAARGAVRDAELRKRSYWEFLDGYAFERATAEVLKRHQFNPTVTPGSGDGGIDIEVIRNGLKGIV